MNLLLKHYIKQTKTPQSRGPINLELPEARPLGWEPRGQAGLAARSCLGREPGAGQVTLTQLFMAFGFITFFFFFLPGLGDNRSLIRAGARRWRLRGGGASQGWRLPGPDLFPGKNPGNPPLAQLLKRRKLHDHPFPLPFLPRTSRRSCGKASAHCFLGCRGGGGSGEPRVAGSPASDVGTLFPSGWGSSENWN